MESWDPRSTTTLALNEDIDAVKCLLATKSFMPLDLRMLLFTMNFLLLCLIYILVIDVCSSRLSWMAF